MTFPSEAYVKAFKFYANQTDASCEDGALRLSVKGSEGTTFDPYMIFDFSGLESKASADENKFVTLVYKMPTTNSRASGPVKYYGTEVCKNYSENNPKQFTYMKDVYDTVQFDMSGISDWTGDITDMRIDYLFATGADGDTMYIHNIIFSKTAAAGTALAKSIADELNKEPEPDPEETEPLTEPVTETETDSDTDAGSEPETDTGTETDRETEPVTDTETAADGSEPEPDHTTPEGDKKEAGDCNGDGEINNKDVVFLFRYVSGGAKEEDESVYDFNGDKEVNNKDVVELFRFASTR